MVCELDSEYRGGCRWRRRRPSASNRASSFLYPSVVGYSSETTARIRSDLQLAKSASSCLRLRAPARQCCRPRQTASRTRKSRDAEMPRGNAGSED